MNELGLDVEATLRDLGFNYVKRGNDLLIHCPSGIHTDKNPSLRVHSTKGMFNCFACGYKGNLITLARDMGKNINSFLDKANIDFAKLEEERRLEELRKEEERKSLKILFTGEQKSFFDNPRMRNYLANKVSILDDQFIKDRKITYCTYVEVISNHLKDDEDVKPTKFINRILFPIFDPVTKHLVNIEGRTFKNATPKTIYPRGAVTDLLYNYENCDLSKPIILVEGIKDFCKVWNIDTNVVATFNPFLQERQLKQLMTFESDIIVFIDNDDAGWNGLEKLDDLLPNKEIYFCYNPKKKADPFDTSFEMIADLISSPITLTEKYIRDIRQKEKVRWT